jgi:hypothetical protein
LTVLLIEIAHLARQVFEGKTLRIWYAMLGPKAWKTIILNVANKDKLIESPVKPSAQESMVALRDQLKHKDVTRKVGEK